MLGRTPHACLTVSSFVLALAACGPQYPVEYETEHLRVAKAFDAPVCAGTLRDMELDAARIAEQLDGHEYAPIDVVLGTDAVNEHCPPNSSGCTKRADGLVYTEFRSVGHELVHAFAGEKIAIPFIEEGLAEALGGGMSSVHWFDVDTASVSITEAIIGPTTGDGAAYIKTMPSIDGSTFSLFATVTISPDLYVGTFDLDTGEVVQEQTWSLDLTRNEIVEVAGRNVIVAGTVDDAGELVIVRNVDPTAPMLTELERVSLPWRVRFLEVAELGDCRPERFAGQITNW